MSHRRVRAITMNEFGYVAALFNDEEAWSPQHVEDVILDLELGSHDYYVQWPEKNTDVFDAEDSGGRYLRTDRNPGPHNDLTDLPVWVQGK